jgi:hypothetical protein
MMRRMLTIAAVLAIIISTLVTAAGNVTFGYQFTPGKSEKYRLKINTDMEMTGMAASQVANMEVTVACVSKKADAYAMTLTFDKVDASNTIGGNTATDPNAMKMIGKAVTFTVNTHGDVSDIAPGAGFDSWADVQQVIEPTLKNWYVYLPGTAVAAGGTWKRENYRDKNAAGANYVSNESFKFREMKKDKGHNVAMVDEDVTTEVGGSTQTPVGVFNLAGTGKGKFEFQFDPAAGAIRFFNGTMTTDINMTPQSGGDAMKTSVKNTIEREMIE